MPESVANIETTHEQDAPAHSAERILFTPEPCTRLDGEECNRCQRVCPAGAISFDVDGTPVIDDARCTRCGICIGICDSFGSDQATTYDFAKRMERKGKDDQRIYLCCEEDVFEGLEPAANVFVLKCLSSVPPELLCYLLSHGIKVVCCHDLSYCEDCTIGGAMGGKLWQRAFELAGTWAGREVEFAESIPEVERFTQKMSAPDRRTLFTAPVGALGEVASGEYRARKSSAIEDFLARQERLRARGSAASGQLFLDEESQKAAIQSKSMRKRLMAEAIASDPDIASRAPYGPEDKGGHHD